jgi:hypothetical protein
VKQLFLAAALAVALVACPSTGGTNNNPGGNTNPPAVTVPYYGEWTWTVALGNDQYYEGYLSISKKADDTDTIKSIGAGDWRWCTPSGCGSAGDIGMIGTYYGSSGAQLSTSFVDVLTSGIVIKLAAFDSDNRIGTEVSGLPTFSGAGTWFNYDGSTALVGIAMTKRSNTPTVSIASASSVQTLALPDSAGVKSASASGAAGLQAAALEHLKAITR